MGATANTVADNVRRLRAARGMSLRALSDELKKAGHPLSADAINKIENGRTLEPGAETPKQIRRVDVDDLAALANALRVSPLALLLPWASTSNTPAEVTGGGTVPARAAWQWGQGARPLAPSESDFSGETLRFRVDSTPGWARSVLDERYNEVLAESVVKGVLGGNGQATGALL